MLVGSTGSDIVVNDGGNPRIDCGSAFDRVVAGAATDVCCCEATFTP